MALKSCIVGVDFGTTSLSAVIMDTHGKQIRKTFTYQTDAYIPFPDPDRKEQSVEKLESLFSGLMKEIMAYPGISIECIGFTGQMHGIIGLDKAGKAVTELVTWQDKRGQKLLPGGTTLQEKIRQVTGHPVSEGYGILPLYEWLIREQRKDITGFCTVADYFAHQLVNTPVVSIDAGNAHSIGLFDLYTGNWDKEAITRLGLPYPCFPEIVTDEKLIGYVHTSKGDIPVMSAIGDNQASFRGSVGRRKDVLLLNVGTGTQLSFLIPKKDENRYHKYIDGYQTQLRPFDDKHFLVATSFVNGGAVYNALFRFFRQTAIELFGMESIESTVLWKAMEKAAGKVSAGKKQVKVKPLFDKERGAENANGIISGLDMSNFYPGDLIVGVLTGLAEYYKTAFFPELQEQINQLYGSGNGLKKNRLLCDIVSRVFGYPLQLTSYQEEAAVGAALYALESIDLVIQGKRT
ncbi:MAG: hypothetical protein LUH10_07150 [Tannerellaceae bacterium]|nr:hypothetical protein [Tannerellaceae bacterium]